MLCTYPSHLCRYLVEIDSMYLFLSFANNICFFSTNFYIHIACFFSSFALILWLISGFDLISYLPPFFHCCYLFLLQFIKVSKHFVSLTFFVCFCHRRRFFTKYFFVLYKFNILPMLLLYIHDQKR